MSEYALKFPGDLYRSCYLSEIGLSSLPVTLPFSTKGNTVVSTIFFDTMDYLFGPAASADSPFRRIYVDDLDVSAEMVRQGAAWVYRKYAKDQNLFKLEDEARAAKRGLWGLSEAQRVPPWEWRRR